MADRASPLAGESRNRRARLVQALLVFSIVGAAGVLFMFKFAGETETSAEIKLKNPLSIARVDGVDAEELWISKGESRIGLAEQRLEELEELMADTVTQNKQLAVENSELKTRLETMEKDARAVIDEQAALINGTAATIDPDNPFAAIPPPPPDVDSFDHNQQPPDRSADPFGPTGPTVPAPVAGGDILAIPTTLVRFKLNERPAPESGETINRQAIRDTKYYLPAGAHARAVIIAGAAAPVSVTGQADPRPVLIRLTGPAWSAARSRGNRIKADIGGCVVTGEARGDLSSERVYVRLQTMTCHRGEGVIETQVQGFVAGTGQAGVRGDVITREGNLVQKSALAGILSGFGNSVNQGLTPSGSVIRDGSARSDDGDLLDNAFKAGLGKGIGNAGDRLAQYYIKRAEQYQPVVSLKGGTPVEVVFIAGAWLDGRPRTAPDSNNPGEAP